MVTIQYPKPPPPPPPAPITNLGADGKPKPVDSNGVTVNKG